MAIAAGGNHALARKSNGTLWAWGQNAYGQIGDGTTTNRTTPTQITSLGTSVTLIGANAYGYTSHAQKSDGTLWAWGNNANGEVGDGTLTARLSPVQTSGLTGVTALGGGNATSYAVSASGGGKSWGYGFDGELGNGTTTYQQKTPVDVSSLSSLLMIQGGSSHAIAVKTDGTVWTWGYNTSYQLGDGTNIQKTTPVQPSGPASVMSVAGGGLSSVAVSSDGRVWTWGYNGYGQLGDGTTNERKTPVQISDPGFVWRVATPNLNPFGGASSSNMSVTVTCVTPSATIHYTTSGVDPTESDPTVTSGGVVTITQTTTLKAKAWLSGTPASNVTSATYTLTVATPSFSPVGGTYITAQNVTLSTATSGATIRYTTDGSTPTGSSPAYSSPIPVSTGTTIKAIGFKTGWTTSGMATAIYTFNYGTLAAPVFTPAPAQVGYGTQVSLSAAAGATIRYTTNGTTPIATSPIYTGPIAITGTVTIYAKAFHPDWTTSAQSGGAYTVKVATPVFSPDAGSYAPGQLVTITNATPGAVIRYTTNGAAPTTSDPIIATGGTVVAGNYTLKAQGFITGWTSSDIKTAAYALTGPLTPYKVVGGNNHTVGLRNDGTVWTWGSNGGGALGDGSTGRSTAAVVNGLTGVIDISAGTMHTLALRTDGTVWAWGNNGNGQLGDNTTTSRSMFAAVSGLTSVTAITASSLFSAALKSNGTVWTWGLNGNGQLGDGTTVQRLVPTQVTALTSVVAIAAGGTHMLARKSDGSVWAWGYNSYGQLGDGTSTQRTSPGQVSGIIAAAGPWAGTDHSLAQKADGSLYAWGSNNAGQLGDGTLINRSVPTLVASLSSLAAADGSGFSIGVRPDGTVWAWGDNYWGELGDGTTATRTTPYQVAGLPGTSGVSAGWNFSVAVTADGSVWAWGDNASGQLGDGTLDRRLSPVQISESGFAWKTSTPRLSPYGGAFTAVTTVTVTAVTPGATIRYTTNGVDPTPSDPTVASGGTVAVDQTLTLKARAWAAGLPVSNVASAAFTMSLPLPAVSPAAGTYFVTQTVTMSSSVIGATIRYTLDGTDPTSSSTVYSSGITVDATTTVKTKAFKAGWTDSGVQTNVYTMKVVPPVFSPGGGSYGAPQTVTISTTTPSTTIRYTTNGTEPTAASPVYSTPITVGATTTVKAIASRGGWVTSDSGAASYWITLGTVATPTFAPGGGTYAAPVDVTLASATAGASLRYTVDGTDPTPASPLYVGPMRVSTTTTIKARGYKGDLTPSAVATATYALDAGGAVDTPVLSPVGGWSATARTVTATVQLAGAVIHYTTSGVDPVEADPTVASGGTIAVDRSMVVKVKAWKSGLLPSAVRRADFIVTGAIAVRDMSSYALKADGTLWAWGNNGSGQLGDGTAQWRTSPVAVSGMTTVVGVAAGLSHALAVKANGTVWAWGANGSGQLGDGTTTNRAAAVQVSGLTGVVAVAAGDTHSLALKADGTVWSWGSNASGQLGDGTTTTRLVPVVVPGLLGVMRIAAGNGFSFALKDDGVGSGTVWAWGGNAYGQLGDQSVIMRLWPVQVIGPSQVTAIAAGRYFALAVQRDRTLWAWGNNGYGELGDGTMTDRPTPVRILTLSGVTGVTAGTYHSAATTADGRVWTWGSNDSSQLGGAGTVSRSHAEAIGGIAGGLAVAAGLHTLALQPDGTLKAWGTNGWGQIGDGTTTVRPTPVVAAGGLTLATNTWLTGDADGDGLPTWREYLLGTDPLNADTNGDGIPDGAEAASTLDPANPDVDSDGLSNWVEIALGTDPFRADTDGDDVPDGADAFPLDPTRSQPLSSDPNDHTAPTITLTEPTNAVPVP